MLKRERIGICTLCAPYASRRHGRRGWRAPVSLCEVRRKSGAVERTRTADLLITNQHLPLVPLAPEATDHRLRPFSKWVRLPVRPNA